MEAHVAIRNKSSQNSEAGRIALDSFHRKPSRLFARAVDTDDTKQKVINAMIGPAPYHVSHYYKTKGFIQAIARSPAFDNTSLFVIAANALYIGVVTDWNKGTPLRFGETRSFSNSPTSFVVVENFFCAYFLGEWIIRFT